jgi:YHS domain-containing protein
VAQYGGAKLFYFCSEDCREAFEESPQQYARRSA